MSVLLFVRLIPEGAHAAAGKLYLSVDSIFDGLERHVVCGTVDGISLVFEEHEPLDEAGQSVKACFDIQMDKNYLEWIKVILNG